jgi:transposase, IS30 family
VNYQQLTRDERYQIQALKTQGVHQAEIARRVKRTRSTISRELRRNSTTSDALGIYYSAVHAEQRVAARRKAKGRNQRRIRGDLQVLVEQKLRLAWSPEQISGRLWHELSISMSHETIYQHVLRDSFEQQGMLRYCLRFGGYKHHRFRKSTCHARTRKRKLHIDDRPAAANERTEQGHWERDCIVGVPGGAALLTVVDRKTRFTRIRRIPKLTAEAAGQATLDALRPHGATLKTLTNDNGIEFGRDEQLHAALGAPIYFCDPSSPWQRGTIENTNGLIRQYVAKGTNIDELDPRLPQAIEDSVNHRPRKTLDWRTPHEEEWNERTVLMSGTKMMRLGLEFSA